MECTDCKKEFTANPFNRHKRQLCPECRIINVRQIKVRYKQTDKGKQSEERWINSEQRSNNEKRYRQEPHAKELAVQRTTRFLIAHPEMMDEKRRINRIYIYRTQGHLKQWWREHSESGCMKCGSSERLSIDHIIPRSLGGTDDITNLQVLCVHCNSEKGTQIIDYAACRTSDR